MSNTNNNNNNSILVALFASRNKSNNKLTPNNNNDKKNNNNNSDSNNNNNNNTNKASVGIKYQHSPLMFPFIFFIFENWVKKRLLAQLHSHSYPNLNLVSKVDSLPFISSK